MLQPVFTTSFQKDVKRVEKRGYDMEKLKEVIKLILLNQRPLPPKYKDHPLRGKWQPKWELHIEPDWLLIYQIARGSMLFCQNRHSCRPFFAVAGRMEVSYCCAPTMRA